MGVLKWARTALAGAVLMASGCASKPVQVAAPAVSIAVSYATIVSIRPVVVATGRGADLLNAIGGVPAADIQSFSHGQEMEFIVLEDGVAQPISVVQGNELQFRAGERIVLVRDGHTRLRRAGA